MRRIFIAAALFAAVSCMAQTAPATVKNAFTKSFPGVTVKKWDKEDGKYEANFVKDGKSMSATFTAEGNLEETETDIKVVELPSAIADYIKSNYKGATLKEAGMIVRGTQKMYEAEVKGKDLLFDMQGKFLKEEED